MAKLPLKVNYVKVNYLQGKAGNPGIQTDRKKQNSIIKDNELSGTASRWYPNEWIKPDRWIQRRTKRWFGNGLLPNGNKASQSEKFDEGEVANGKLTRWNTNGDKVEELMTFKDHKNHV